MNKQKEATCERGERDDRRAWGESKAYSATDGDSVATWVEPSEGVSVLCVCVWGTPGYHDNPTSRQVAEEVRAPAWLLLGGLLEFSSGMPPKPRTPLTPSIPPVASEATWGEDHGKEEELVPLESIHR